MFPLGIHGSLGFGFPGINFPNPESSPELLFQCLIEPRKETSEGILIQTVALPWMKILKEIQHNSDFLM